MANNLELNSFKVCALVPLPPPFANPVVFTSVDAHETALPPPESPPTARHNFFPPCSLLDDLMHPASPTSVSPTMINLRGNQELNFGLAQLPLVPSLMDSVTHVVCSLRVFGVRGDDRSAIKIMCVAKGSGILIDGRSNICVTGNLSKLLDVEDIIPINISVVLKGTSFSLDNKITKRGLLPLTLSDSTIYYQTCFYCANMINTIISLMAILASSDIFYFWNQEGCKDPTVPGWLRFTSKDGLLSMFFNLEYRDGLYYCSMDVLTVNLDPICVSCNRAQAPTPSNTNRLPSKFDPTSKARRVKSEVWMLCLGSPGEHQLNVLPTNVINMPSIFEYHSFQSIDFKEQAYICKQATQQTAECIPTCGAKFFIDFVFMRSSTEDYKWPNKPTD
jgi:hypothetical protein